MAHTEEPTFYSPAQRAQMSAGLITRPGFFGNQSVTAAGQAFKNAAESGGGMSGVIDAIRQVKDSTNGSISKQTINRAYDLPWDPTIAAEVAKVANKIAQLSNIRFEDAEDFLYILITIDSHEVMIKFATATDIAELADANIMMKPLEILAIPGIEKVAYLADAISAILRAYRKYTNAENYDNKGESKSNSDSLAAIQTALGLASSFFSPEDGGVSYGPMNGATPSSILGAGLTKLIRGKEIPIGVQANNPMLSPLSMIGMMFFGAAPNTVMTMDTDLPINKLIAVFGGMGDGAGYNSFKTKNTGSLSNLQSLGSLINNMFGVKKSAGGQLDKNQKILDKIPDSYDAKKHGRPIVKKGEPGEGSDLLKSMIGTVAQLDKFMPKAPNLIEKFSEGIGEIATGILGGNISNLVDMTKADNAVPIQSAISNAMNGMQDIIPKITTEFRENFPQLFSTMDGIGSLFSTMTNLENALKTGLTPQSLMAVAGMFSSGQIKPPSIFPTSVFQEGWQNMAAVNQALGKDNRFYQQVLYILNHLG